MWVKRKGKENRTEHVMWISVWVEWKKSRIYVMRIVSALCVCVSMDAFLPQIASPCVYVWLFVCVLYAFSCKVFYKVVYWTTADILRQPLTSRNQLVSGWNKGREGRRREWIVEGGRAAEKSQIWQGGKKNFFSLKNRQFYHLPFCSY